MNYIGDNTFALITDSGSTGTPVYSKGAMSLTAQDTSEIDALSFDVAVGAVGATAAVSANVIGNTIEANIEGGSKVQSDSTLSQTAESSAIIRTLDIGAAVSGGFSLGVTVLGNYVDNTVEALITGPNTTVTTKGAITLLAEDEVPSNLSTSWTDFTANVTNTGQTSNYNSATQQLPGPVQRQHTRPRRQRRGVGGLFGQHNGPRQRDSEQGRVRDHVVDGQRRRLAR